MSSLYKIVLPENEDTGEAGAALAAFVQGDIPTIAEIEPQPDPVYGHTFKWPEEVKQFLSGSGHETH